MANTLTFFWKKCDIFAAKIVKISILKHGKYSTIFAEKCDIFAAKIVKISI